MNPGLSLSSCHRWRVIPFDPIAAEIRDAPDEFVEYAWLHDIAIAGGDTGIF
jgi:hypothetical protein